MINRNQMMRAFSSLAPISEVYSNQSMHIGNKIEYSGSIKRDTGLLSAWSARNFILRIGDSQKAELAIVKSEKTVEEVLYLKLIKITKKCLIIQDRPCFGVVMEDKKKYLISLKNVHECQRFHAEMTQIKKMEKQLIRAFNQNRCTSVRSKQKTQQLHEKEKIKKQSNQIIETNEESDQMSESEQSERINNRYRKRYLGFKSMQSSEQGIFQTNFREVATSVSPQKEESIFLEVQNFFNQNQNTLLNTNYGLIPYPGCQKQKILINNENTAKSTFIINTSASIHSCIKFFLSFSSWNPQIKKSQTINNTENGHILYFQFMKPLAASQSRCAIGQVSLLENEYGASLKVKSVKRANYEYLSQKKEVKMELLLKMVTDRSNRLQKVMTVALSIKPSKEEFELAVKFLKEIKEFQSQCKKLI